MRSIVSLLIPGVVTGALGGCGTIATEYVPRTPDKATIGVKNGAVGVYKNGSFAKLGSTASTMLACSAPALTAATAGAAHESEARFDAIVAGLGWGLLWVFPPLVALGAGFSALSEREREASFALAVDAVNLHNDNAACIGALAPAAGARP